ncbi:squalene-hopene/tetraprenyl-beta-curcumene cyclase [Allocatelliglobosispora scoriae]|uniref:Squalene-hopene/tetraprenyl-beta-curcumene cyclase n=1 Tax=Allocatelliglobosispora scoriae TaxID=643052 RepID=A0A841BIL2_9ACTN|nr:prenyltransferase/squalene oxidase repeat-containing protein [Allocatelliglobosispora scoriae]MBB5867445.1 squalene-hopene/tetraprenyl-beta-curcumene cyclase [Allocatelliglobosispora scoriae]
MAAARDSVRRAVLARVAGDGAVRDPCHGRALETALLLSLMDRVGYTSPARDSLARFLDSRRQPARLLSEQLLREVPDFTVDRKRATLCAFLVALGEPLPHGAPDPADLTLEGLHPWARVQITAVKAILAAATGRPESITPDDHNRLLDTQQAEGVWEHNLLVHLSVLHGLAHRPDTTHVVRAGIAKALDHQRHDGGIPFVSDVDTWCTATAGVALTAAQTDPAALHPLAEHLVGRQAADGGWSFTDTVQLTDTDDVSVAVEFLHALDPHRYRNAISRGLAYLRGRQGPDGGFPTYAATPAEACMTAAAANALLCAPQHHRTHLDQALGHLMRSQRDDGSFPADWSASRLHTPFRAVLAATQRETADDPRAVRIAAKVSGAILGTQNPDGGWGQRIGDASDAISTSYAVIALTRGPESDAAARGVEFLLGSLRDDGGIASVPDSIGPRPFTFTVPALADIFALLALGHVQSRIEGTARR